MALQNQVTLPPRLAQFLASRQRDVVSTQPGQDTTFDPSEFELRDAQAAETEKSRQRTGGGFSFTPSRESLRKDAIQRMRRGLGIGEIEHRQAVEQEVLPTQVKGTYDVEAARMNAEAANTRAQTNQDSIMERLQAQIAATGAGRDQTQEGLNTRQESGQQFRVDNPSGSAGVVPEGLYSAVSEAEGNLPTTSLGKFFDFGGDAKRTEVENSLSNLLDRQGVLQATTLLSRDIQRYSGSLQERFEQLANDPEMGLDEEDANYLQSLSPYQTRYLELKIREQ